MAEGQNAPTAPSLTGMSEMADSTGLKKLDYYVLGREAVRVVQADDEVRLAAPSTGSWKLAAVVLFIVLLLLVAVDLWGTVGLDPVMRVVMYVSGVMGGLTAIAILWALETYGRRQPDSLIYREGCYHLPRFDIVLSREEVDGVEVRDLSDASSEGAEHYLIVVCPGGLEFAVCSAWTNRLWSPTADDFMVGQMPLRRLAAAIELPILDRQVVRR